MKSTILSLSMLLLIAGSFVACNDDDVSSTSIFVDREEQMKSEFDLWLERHFVNTYNVQVEYRMPDHETNYGYWVSPPPVRQSIHVAKCIKYTVLDAMAEMQADKEDPLLFAKMYFPRSLFFVGCHEISNTGTVVLASAENGLKINFLGVNYFEPIPGDAGQVAGTMMHEFMHILDGTKAVPKEFDLICSADYIGDKYTSAGNDYLDYGFLSNYARSSTAEDVAVTGGYLVTADDAWWEETLAKASEEGRAKIEKKRAIMKAWLMDEFGVDNEKWCEVYNRRLNSLDKIDWDNLDD